MTRRIFASLLFLAGACTGTASNNPKGGNALGFAIVNSDFKSTSISLADPTTGMLAQDDCIDSGSMTSLSMALSGDVVIASSPQADDQLVVIDQTNSALAYLSATTCTVTKQVSVSTGFFSNPHDVVSITPTKSYVTRYEANATPSGTAGANDQGNDVLVFDPTTGTIASRIDMTQYATSAALQARPDHALLANGKVYVTLSNLSGDFKTAGAARIVVIDPNTDAVTGTLDLSAQKDCSGIDYIASSKTLVVGCTGDYNDPTNQSAQSGIVLVDVSGPMPTVKKTLGVDQFANRAPAGFGVVGDNLLFVITSGDFSGTPPDALWSYDIDTSTPTKVIDADGAFALGSIVADASNHLAFVTDASMTKPVVRVFDVSNRTAITQTSSFVSNPKSGLPPRQIGWY